MTDWQVGDLALCVVPSYKGPNVTRPGHLYTVDEVFTNQAVLCLCLGFVGVPTRKPGVYYGHRASRFVKITPGAKIEGVEVERRVPTPKRVKQDS